MTSKTIWSWATELSSLAPDEPTPAWFTRNIDVAGSLEHLAHDSGHRFVVGYVERQEDDSVPILPRRCLAARPVDGEAGAE